MNRPPGPRFEPGTGGLEADFCPYTWLQTGAEEPGNVLVLQVLHPLQLQHQGPDLVKGRVSRDFQPFTNLKSLHLGTL